MRIRADSATAGRYTIMSLLGVVKLSVFFISFSFFSLFVSGELTRGMNHYKKTNAPVFVFSLIFSLFESGEHLESTAADTTIKKRTFWLFSVCTILKLFLRSLGVIHYKKTSSVVYLLGGLESITSMCS